MGVQITNAMRISRFSAKYSSCRLELRNLVLKKREQFQCDQVTKDLLDHAAWEHRPPPPSWRPKGQLVAHLHEHRGAVNRYRVLYYHGGDCMIQSVQNLGLAGSGSGFPSGRRLPSATLGSGPDPRPYASVGRRGRVPELGPVRPRAIRCPTRGRRAWR